MAYQCLNRFFSKVKGPSPTPQVHWTFGTSIHLLYRPIGTQCVMWEIIGHVVSYWPTSLFQDLFLGTQFKLVQPGWPCELYFFVFNHCEIQPMRWSWSARQQLSVLATVLTRLLLKRLTSNLLFGQSRWASKGTRFTGNMVMVTIILTWPWLLP